MPPLNLFAKVEEEHARARRGRLEDLAVTAHSPAGFRLLLRLLRHGGVCRAIGTDAVAVARHNDAALLLADIFHAAPETGLALVAARFAMPTVRESLKGDSTHG